MLLNIAVFCFGIPAYSEDSDQKPIQSASHRLHIFHHRVLCRTPYHRQCRQHWRNIKQCRPGSGTALCGAPSGPAPFVYASPHIWNALLNLASLAMLQLMLLFLTFQQTMQAQTRRSSMRRPVRAGTDCICIYPTCG